MSGPVALDPEPAQAGKKSGIPWLNSTVLGIGLASLFSDWSHETASTVLPAFLATMGVSAAWLGAIEGVSDGLASFAKMASGYYTDKLARRKPIAVAGYVVTALGTASFGLATSAWHVMLGRASAWLGKGVRTPVRKALLAGAVTKENYGRAFGFERMLDTIGAIIGPASALVLLEALHHNYKALFAWTLVPGLAAALVVIFLVKEKERKRVPHISFGERLRLLPWPYRRFLVAVGLFGAGDFAPTMLILLATQKLTPTLGAAKAASVAVALYVVRNIFYLSFALVAGWLSDRFPKRYVLGTGYFLGALMAVGIVVMPFTIWSLALIFIVSGIYSTTEETLEDSFCAELVDERHHGMAFGVLATVNGVGDFLSSVIVGALWTLLGTQFAFGYCAVLFFAGALLVWMIRPQPASAGATT